MLSLSKNLFPKLVVPLSKIKTTHVAPLSITAHNRAGHGEMAHVGNWPRTKEERERAAKKYNLIPEDYEPYDELEAFGDYPKLKAIGAFNRDKYDDYDDPTDMRFYGEVYHKDADLYYWERIDPLAHEKNYVPIWLKALVFLSAIVTLPALKWIIDNYKIEINHPWKQRKVNPPGHVYYQFPASASNEHH